MYNLLGLFVKLSPNLLVLLGISLMVEQRTLTPSVLVRVQDPQPIS